MDRLWNRQVKKFLQPSWQFSFTLFPFGSLQTPLRTEPNSPWPSSAPSSSDCLVINVCWDCVGAEKNKEEIISNLIIRLDLKASKMNQIARCDWLPEWARWNHLACSGLPAVFHKKNFPESHWYNKSFIDQVCSVKMAGYWPHSFFCEFMDLDFVSVHEHTQKNNLANIQPSWPHTWSITHISCDFSLKSLYKAGHVVTWAKELICKEALVNCITQMFCYLNWHLPTSISHPSSHPWQYLDIWS